VDLTSVCAGGRERGVVCLFGYRRQALVPLWDSACFTSSLRGFLSGQGQVRSAGGDGGGEGGGDGGGDGGGGEVGGEGGGGEGGGEGG
jgi:hypothetical protein